MTISFFWPLFGSKLNNDTDSSTSPTAFLGHGSKALTLDGQAGHGHGLASNLNRQNE